MNKIFLIILSFVILIGCGGKTIDNRIVNILIDLTNDYKITWKNDGQFIAEYKGYSYTLYKKVNNNCILVIKGEGIDIHMQSKLISSLWKIVSKQIKEKDKIKVIKVLKE